MTKVEQRLRGWPTNKQSKLRPIPWPSKTPWHSWWYCYACRTDLLWERPPSNWQNRCREPKSNTGLSSRTVMEDLAKRLRALKGIGIPQEDSQLTWTLRYWRLSDTEPPIKEHTRPGTMSLSSYVADLPFGLHVGPLVTREWALLLARLPSLVSVGEDEPSPADTWYAREGVHPLRQVGKGCIRRETGWSRTGRAYQQRCNVNK